MTKSEVALIRAAQADPAQFEGLYRAYAGRVFGYLYSRVGSRSEAEELTAQTFLAALERLPHYTHKGYFAAWLFAIARHKAADSFRRPPAEPLQAAAQLGAEQDVLADFSERELHAALRQHIAALPAQHAELLRLRYVAGLSFAEIGALLGRSEGAVKKSIYRCLDRLQRQLEVEHV
ncbi:MAG: RNA polymerase sigma factor [Anaerolineales bacterium]|nr:RNA polymerase sigma factor [Anaerolineales bacterium]